MPFLTYPLALIGLLTIPALLTIYFLRRRFRRRPVSSLLLWQSIAKPREGGRILEPTRIPLLFLLELMILVLLVVAAVDLQVRRRRARRPLVVVLDSSASMQARSGAGSAADRARRELLNTVRRGRYQPVRVILARAEPQVLGAPTSGSQALKQMLDDWTPQAPAADLTRALSMARDLGGEAAHVLVLTDQLPPELEDEGRIRWQAVGTPAANAGITRALRTTRDGREDRCLVQIGSYALRRRPVRVTVELDGQPQRSTLLDLLPGQTDLLVFAVPHATGIVRVSLPDDDLALDNEALLLPPPFTRVNTSLQLPETPLRRHFKDALRSSDRAEWHRQTPHLVVTDAPQPSGPDTWQVICHAPTNSVPLAGPFIADRSHPLMRGVDLSGLVWSADPAAVMPGRPLLSAGDAPLITVEPATHTVHLQLDAPRSTLHHSPAWPIWVWNILDWRAAALPGPDRTSTAAGMPVQFGVPPEVAEVTWHRPDGTTQTLATRGGQVTLQPQAVGIHTLVIDEETRHSVAVHLAAPRESDLREHLSESRGSWTDADTLRRDYASLAWPCLLAALALLTIHHLGVAAGRRAAS